MPDWGAPLSRTYPPLLAVQEPSQTFCLPVRYLARGSAHDLSGGMACWVVCTYLAAWVSVTVYFYPLSLGLSTSCLQALGALV